MVKNESQQNWGRYGVLQKIKNEDGGESYTRFYKLVNGKKVPCFEKDLPQYAQKDLEQENEKATPPVDAK